MSSPDRKRQYGSSVSLLIFLWCSTFLVLTLWDPTVLQAQVSGSILEGIVTDAQGGVVPNAGVTVLNEVTRVTNTTKTNASGYYQFPAINPGAYDLTVTVPGFSVYARNGFQLVLGQRLSVDCTLQVSATKQTVTVTGTPTVLDTTTANDETLVTGDLADNIPTYGRNVFVVDKLMAGVIPFYGSGNGGSDNVLANRGTGFLPANVSFDGQPSQSNTWFLDGLPDVYGGGAITWVPPKDATAEVVVEPFTLNAEFGETGGSVVTSQTKSGTNGLHGLLYYYQTQKALQASSFFGNKAGLKKGQNFQHDIGFNVGGPVVIPHLYNGKDRTFWFFDFERNQFSSTTLYTNSVPTAMERQGNFSQTGVNIYNPFTTTLTGGQLIRQQFQGNVLPSNMMSKVAQNLLNNWIPLPTNSGEQNNDVWNLWYPYHTQSFHFRVDEHVTNNDAVFFSYAWTAGVTPAIANFPSGINGEDSYSYKHLASLGWTHTLNPTWLLNVRVGTSDDHEGYVPFWTEANRLSLPWPSSLLSAFPATSGPPWVYNTPDMNQIGTYDYNLTAWTPVLRIYSTKITGRHSLDFGYEGRVRRIDYFTDVYGGGLFQFSRAPTQGPVATVASATSGYSVASMLLGTMDSSSFYLNANYAGQILYHGLYVQDNWRATPKLTVNAGLRWDYSSPPTERYNRFNGGWNPTATSPIASQVAANLAASPIAALPPSAVQTLSNLQGGITFAGVGQSRETWSPVYDDFGPRIGAAYRIGDKTVVRGGYGVYYLPMTDYEYVNVAQYELPITQNGFSQTTAATTSLNNLPYNLFDNPFPTGVLQPPGASQGLATFLGQSFTTIDGKNRVGHSQAFQVSLQHEFPSSIRGEIALVGDRVGAFQTYIYPDALPAQYLALGTQLTTPEPNPFYGVITSGTLSHPTVSLSQLLLPHPQFTGITQGYTPIGSSWYNGLQVSGTKVFSKGVTLMANWTWSKNINDQVLLNSVDTHPTPFISNIDRPQRLNFSGQWELPVGKGEKYGANLAKPLLGVIGNWKLSWISCYGSGQPVGPFSSAIATGQPVLPSGFHQTLGDWFNKAAFAPLPPYTLNSLSTNNSRIYTDSAKFINLDLMKDFPIHESVKLQIRAEFNNLTNTPQFGPPNTSVTSSALGSVTSVENTSRLIFVAARLAF